MVLSDLQHFAQAGPQIVWGRALEGHDFGDFVGLAEAAKRNELLDASLAHQRLGRLKSKSPLAPPSRPLPLFNLGWQRPGLMERAHVISGDS